MIFKILTENDTIKIGLINATSLGISFANIDNLLRVTLLVVSIAYTAFKLWREIMKEK